MIAVQSDLCSPVADFFSGKDFDASQCTQSIANGLIVPTPFGMSLIMKVIRESKGFSIAIPEDQIIEGIKQVSQMEGILLCPEGAALWTALIELVDEGLISRHQKILLLNTANGYKYLDQL